MRSRGTKYPSSSHPPGQVGPGRGKQNGVEAEEKSTERERYKKFAWEKMQFAWDLPGIPGKFDIFPGNCLGFAWEMPGPRQICLGSAWAKGQSGRNRANWTTFAWKVNEFAWEGWSKRREKSQPKKVLYLWGQKKICGRRSVENLPRTQQPTHKA